MEDECAVHEEVKDESVQERVSGSNSQTIFDALGENFEDE